MLTILSAAIVFLLLPTLYAVYLRTKRRTIRDIKGPQAPFWTGNILDFSYQQNVGDLDFKYMEEYGLVWRMTGPIGQNVLLITDPKALQHVLHKSAYNYPKGIEAHVMAEMISSRSIFTAADGHSHSRHRKVMNPAFSASQLRTFLPHFRSNAFKLCHMWKQQIQETNQGGKVIPVNKGLARMTLDILGQTAFHYDFGALEQSNNHLAVTYDNMFSDATLYPSLSLSVFRETWWWMPRWCLPFVKYVPTRQNIRLRQAWSAFEGVANTLVDNATEEATTVEIENGKKDVMSVLVRANLSENPSLQLSKHEMVSEMSGLASAGHETTANTVTWLLWEMCKQPHLQDQLLNEIKRKREEIRERNGDDVDFSMEDLEGMPFLQALLKEVLRFHPIVYHLSRFAATDDVIPLSEPLTTLSGKVIDQIPISRGQRVQLSLCGYNRIKAIWGEDAEEFNPMRFINGKVDNTIRVGIFGNLISFSGGVRGCIGWRFSLIEMQAIIVALVENFEFSLPSPEMEVLRMPVTLMSPMVKGKLDEGIMMPLNVRPRFE